ncbi:MAG TPA: nicotinate-nucleotide diphosphorylase (carboxylating), partial [Kofleriaceae bacterium]
MAPPVLGGLAAFTAVRRLIELALDEDLGRGDVTSQVTLRNEGRRVVADMNAREPIVAFGVDVAAAVFALVDPRIDVEVLAPDGTRVDKGGLILTVTGPAHN